MSAKILVIDDEPLILVTIEKALVKKGYQVIKAGNPEEFVRALSEAPFDLLLTDVFMEGLSVEEVIRQVRTSSPDACIIKMSGSVNREKSANFLEKPFRIEDLRDKVRQALDKSSRG